jgi:integrase
LSIPEEQIHSTSLLEWATAYLEYAQDKFVADTFHEKVFAFKQLLQFPGLNPDTPAEELKPITVLKHLNQQEKNRSGNAANKDRKNLLAAWKWGVQFMGLPAMHNPIATVFKYAEVRHERRVPSLEEFWAVYAAADTAQDKLMLLMYLQTGARRDELFRLLWKDVDFTEGRVRLWTRKNKAGEWESAYLPIKEELAALLRTQQRVTGFRGNVFLDQCHPDPQRWIAFKKRQHWIPRLCSRANIQPFGLHGIRHLTASILALAKQPLVEIQHMLRHKSIGTTERYIHSLTNGNRGVLESLPDLNPGSKSPLESPLKSEAI